MDTLHYTLVYRIDQCMQNMIRLRFKNIFKKNRKQTTPCKTGYLYITDHRNSKNVNCSMNDHLKKSK